MIDREYPPQGPGPRLHLVCGGPRTGKSTYAAALAAALGVELLRTDDLIGSMDWSAASEEAARWIELPGRRVIEGVAVFRALRKWLAARPGGPLDATIIYLDQPHVPLSRGQASMAKGVETVWSEIRGEALSRGADLFDAYAPPAAAAAPAA